MSKKTSTAGSTLIEALVAMLIVGLVLTAIASILSFSVKNNAQADYRQMAAGIAQDGIEFLRQERGKLGWTAFYAALPKNSTRCFPKNISGLSAINLPANNPPCTASNYSLDTPPVNFTRSLIIANETPVDPSKIQVTVKVSWNDGSGTRDVDIKYDFYKF